MHFLHLGHLLSAGPQLSAFVSHCSANFQPILDSSIQNFELKYEDSENIPTDHVNVVVVFNLHQIKQRNVFWGHLIYIYISCSVSHVQLSHKCIGPHSYTHSYTQLHTVTHSYTQLHTQLHTHIHTYIHTYTVGMMNHLEEAEEKHSY